MSYRRFHSWLLLVWRFRLAFSRDLPHDPSILQEVVLGCPAHGHLVAPLVECLCLLLFRLLLGFFVFCFLVRLLVVLLLDGLSCPLCLHIDYFLPPCVVVCHVLLLRCVIPWILLVIAPVRPAHDLHIAYPPGCQFLRMLPLFFGFSRISLFVVFGAVFLVFLFLLAVFSLVVLLRSVLSPGNRLAR